MAFISANDIVISFAEYEDVQNRDQRLFEANEGLSEVPVEDLLIRETGRILTKIKDSTWWKKSTGTDATTVPDVDPNLIIGRQTDFTDLCVYGALYEYILPKVAKFGDEEDATFHKIDYYQTKFEFQCHKRKEYNMV